MTRICSALAIPEAVWYLMQIIVKISQIALQSFMKIGMKLLKNMAKMAIEQLLANIHGKMIVGDL